MTEKGYVTQVDDPEGENPESQTTVVGGKVLPPESNQTKAVVMMNIFCLANTAQCVLYKIMTERGVDLMEYTLFRNLTIMAISIGLLWF